MAVFTVNNEFRIFYDININNKLSGTIFLFDKPCSTFFYKCVYSNLPFVMYFNENWLKYFTNKYVDLLLYLKSNNLLFFWGEELKMKAYINIIVKIKKLYFILSLCALILILILIVSKRIKDRHSN